jgi:hypothetical protein
MRPSRVSSISAGSPSATGVALFEGALHRQSPDSTFRIDSGLREATSECPENSGAAFVE